MHPDNCRVKDESDAEKDEKVQTKQFHYDEFEAMEVDMEEIIPPPRLYPGTLL